MIALGAITLLVAAANDSGFDPQIGATVPTTLALSDDNGRKLTIGDAIGGRPAILALVYYRCPNLCGFILADLTKAVVGVSGDYSLLVASIDPEEGTKDAAESRAKYGGENKTNWHFLSGDATALERSVGYKAQRDPRTGDFIHPAGLVFLSPQGRVTSYLTGLGYSPESIREALTSGPRTSPSSPIRLLCFDYDAKTGRYSLAITRLLAIFAALTAIALGAYIFFARERR